MLVEQAGRNRAYRRRQKYLKDKRRKEISQYPGYGRNFWYNDEWTNHIKWIDFQTIKKFAKKCGSKAWRRNKDEVVNGNHYKKYFDVAYTVW